jgi:hypothetical protein
MTDSTEDKEEVPRLLRFTGKQADWRMWSQKFKARAKTKKYLYILTGLQKAPSALVGAETPEELKAIQMKKSDFEQGNSVGYSELLSTVFDDISFCIVDEAKTDDLPDGDLHMAWKGLLDMYEPSTPSSRLALKKQFQNSQLMSATLDPDIWITEFVGDIGYIGRSDGPKSISHRKLCLLIEFFVVESTNENVLRRNRGTDQSEN